MTGQDAEALNELAVWIVNLMTPAAVLAQEPVAQDRIEPREQVGAGFEAICGLPRPQEGVLNEIIGTMVVTREAECKGTKAWHGLEHLCTKLGIWTHNPTQGSLACIKQCHPAPKR